ncbi:MAG: hypothetical protein ACJ73E_09535 [Mycobacteriales bacterium]
MAGTDALAAVPGLPETAVPASVLERLPASSPPPPWRLRTRAVVWVARGRPRPAPQRAWPVTVGAVVDYLDGPVGPYREVFGAVLLRRLGLPTVHVPFIAVDSLPSLRAGRAHWKLPKALAGFTGSVRDRVRVDGAGWSVEVAARAYGPRLPAAAPVRSAQGDRWTLVTVRGTVRAALVTVDASGPALGSWLGSGRHAGFVADGHVVVHPAGPAGAPGWGVRPGPGTGGRDRGLGPGLGPGA